MSPNTLITGARVSTGGTIDVISSSSSSETLAISAPAPRATRIVCIMSSSAPIDDIRVDISLSFSGLCEDSFSSCNKDASLLRSLAWATSSGTVMLASLCSISNDVSNATLLLAARETERNTAKITLIPLIFIINNSSTY